MSESSPNIDSEQIGDLDDTFVNKIMTMVNKKASGIQPEYYQINEDSEESVSQEYQPKSYKKSCKKGGKNYQKVRSQEKAKKLGKGKFSHDYKPQYHDKIRPKFQDQMPGKGKKHEIFNNNKQMYNALKIHFEGLLVNMLGQMQDKTNEKLREFSKTLRKLSKKRRRSSSVEVEEVEFSSNREQVPVGPKRKYIKTWMKLECVQKIEQGQTSIKQVAQQFQLKEAVVQSWIANRKQFQEKLNKKNQPIELNDQINFEQNDI